MTMKHKLEKELTLMERSCESLTSAPDSNELNHVARSCAKDWTHCLKLTTPKIVHLLMLY